MPRLTNDEREEYTFFDMSQELKIFNDRYDLIQGGMFYKSKMVLNALNSKEEYIINFNISSEVAIRHKFGYVYLIRGQYKGNELYKIGKANDLIERMKRFEVKIPFDIDLMCSFLVNKPIEFESYLHKMFKDKRRAGEWFDLSLEDIKQITREGIQRESSDLQQAIEKDMIENRKKMWKNKDEYIEYLETMLVLNKIDFNAWGL